MVRLGSLFFLLTVLASADVQNGVVRSGGQAIPGAAVTAECGTDKISTVTDFDGRFALGGLPSASCKFTAAMFGFDVANQEAKASSADLTFDLKLQARATLPSSEPSVTAKATPTTPAPSETKTAAAPATP